MPDIDLAQGVVLDTHAWIWVSAGDARAVRLEHFRGRAFVSAISVWEVAMLCAKGRLTLKPSVAGWVQANTAAPVTLEPLHPQIALASANLENFHGDPADRIIAATALLLGLPLVTADPKMISWAADTASHPVIAL